MRDIQIIKKQLGGTTAIYTIIDGIMQFTIVPNEKAYKVCADKLSLEGVKYNAADPAVQVYVFGDRVNRQYSAGQTMRNAQSSFELKFQKQDSIKTEDTEEVISFLQREDGQSAEHHIIYRKGFELLECFTVYKNGSEKDITIEMLTSFSLGSLTPFELDNPENQIELYRMRSEWCAEAKLEKIPSQELLLEPSWMNYGVRGERFGVVGSMPSRKYMPMIGARDNSENVTWAAVLLCPSSWQLEYYLSQNSLNISGGLADFEFGHWRKNLKTGESITTPHAYIISVCQDIDYATQKLTEIQLMANVPETEKEMPVLYNDWCCNWGNCSYNKVAPLVEKAAELGAKYFVIDAGWAKHTVDENGTNWEVKKDFYPNGIEEIVSLINSKGMVAGIWFEIESFDVSPEFEQKQDNRLLKRDGMTIRNLERVFIDMRDPTVRAELSKNVIDFLYEKGFRYIKVDYNESIGIGCDGYESLGEGLRQQTLATQDFFHEMTSYMPDLVLEVCASGGMRCEPSMIMCGSMMSFSDIHETADEAVVAADIQRILHPSKSQIWATLHKEDSIPRLKYTLACGFYGRLCLSGGIDKLDKEQLAVVDEAISLYNKCKYTIADGFSYFVGITPPQRNLRGYKGVLRFKNDQKEALLVLHSFDDSNGTIQIENDQLEGFKISEMFTSDGINAVITENKINIKGMKPLTAIVLLLMRM